MEICLRMFGSIFFYDLPSYPLTNVSRRLFMNVLCKGRFAQVVLNSFLVHRIEIRRIGQDRSPDISLILLAPVQLSLSKEGFQTIWCVGKKMIEHEPLF